MAGDSSGGSATTEIGVGLTSGARVLKLCTVALGIALGVAVVAGFHRIRSQFAAGPLDVLWPFARPLAAAAVETAFLVGVPVGLAAAAFSALAIPEPRPLATRYAELTRVSLPVVLGLSVLSVVAALAADPGTNRPGRLAAELVEQARKGCLEPDAPREIEVPLVKVRWQCAGPGPRVAGTAPIGRSASFSAAQIELAEDLTRIRLRDLALEAGATPRLRIRAADATISGLRPWGRPKTMPALLRGAVLAACGLAASLLVALAVLGAGVRSRVEPWLTALLVAAAMWTTLSTLDRGERGLGAYALLPLSAASAALLAGLLGRVVKRVARQRSGC